MTKIYAVKDTASGTFGLPFCVKNDALLKRGVAAAVNSEKPNEFNTFVEDKDVYCIGEYDEETAVIRPCNADFKFHCVELKSIKSNENA